MVDSTPSSTTNTPPTSPVKKLRRSGTDRVLGGVCGGLGEYLGFDAIIIRVLAVVLAFASHAGLVLIYFVLWIVIPEADKPDEPIEQRAHEAGEEIKEKAQNLVRSDKSRTWLGAIIIIIGLVALINQFFPWSIFSGEYLWPIVLVVVGLFIIFRK